MSESPTPSPSQRIATVFGWIVAAARRGLSKNAAGLEGPVLMVVYNLIGDRLGQARERLIRLADRLHAGWVYHPKPRAPRKQAAPPAEGSPARPPRKLNPLDTGFGWMLRLAPGPDMGAANWSLSTLLEEPEVAAVLAAAPGPAWRILRPICRMLAVDKPVVLARLGPPRPPRKLPKPAKPPPRPMPWEILPPTPDASYYHRQPSFFWPWIGPKPKTT